MFLEVLRGCAALFSGAELAELVSGRGVDAAALAHWQRVTVYEGYTRRSKPVQVKGSVGEGPNQTNYSDQSSARILAKINSGIFARKSKKIRK